MRVKILIPGKEPVIADWDHGNIFSDEPMFDAEEELIEGEDFETDDFYSTDLEHLFVTYGDVRIVKYELEL